MTDDRPLSAAWMASTNIILAVNACVVGIAYYEIDWCTDFEVVVDEIKVFVDV